MNKEEAKKVRQKNDEERGQEQEIKKRNGSQLKVSSPLPPHWYLLCHPKSHVTQWAGVGERAHA